jgi:hypothetical protein
MKLFQTTIYAFLLSPGRVGGNDRMFFKNLARIEKIHDGGEPHDIFRMGADVVF